jgi:hypothetical protein
MAKQERIDCTALWEAAAYDPLDLAAGLQGVEQRREEHGVDRVLRRARLTVRENADDRAGREQVLVGRSVADRRSLVLAVPRLIAYPPSRLPR